MPDWPIAWREFRRNVGVAYGGTILIESSVELNERLGGEMNPNGTASNQTNGRTESAPGQPDERNGICSRSASVWCTVPGRVGLVHCSRSASVWCTAGRDLVGCGDSLSGMWSSGWDVWVVAATVCRRSIHREPNRMALCLRCRLGGKLDMWG